MSVSTTRFPSGRLVVSKAANAALADAREEAGALLDRHVSGDWGEVEPVRAVMNEIALGIRKPLVSRYRTTEGAALVLVTDEARASTRILLSEEYQP